MDKIEAMTFAARIGRWPRTLIVLIGILGLLFIGGVDYRTPPDISFFIFYLFPVCFVAWFGGVGAGTAIALPSAAIWIWQDIWPEIHYSHPLVPYWNIVAKASVFFLILYLIAKLKSAYEKEKRDARQDPLTGLSNRRAFFEDAQREYLRAKRYGTPLSLAYVDIDNFKQVNDGLGHDGGDALLRRAAALMREHTRDVDIVARLGGDEFAILIPEVPEEGAREAMAKLHRVLTETLRNEGVSVTFSIGLATFLRLPPSVDAMIKESDSLMYAVKRQSKNRLEQHIFQTELAVRDA